MKRRENLMTSDKCHGGVCNVGGRIAPTSGGRQDIDHSAQKELQ